MPNQIQKTVLALGVGVLLMSSSLVARADNDGGMWFGLNMGPVRAWIAPPPVVVVRPPIRVDEYHPGYRGDWRHREARRAWRRHEWREHHRGDRYRRGDDGRDYGYGYGGDGHRD
ncbi:hypothetical protein [Acidihalobacter yilgarnensis]|uniref:hypothetical protein n=1 Tax=Acidihalobacter yilgarnensis TaxID=2819280 RepID=UPI0012E9DF48|nr:hypothetical protein [Acidihalobacter yilgarnensis]